MVHVYMFTRNSDTNHPLNGPSKYLRASAPRVAGGFNPEKCESQCLSSAKSNRGQKNDKIKKKGGWKSHEHRLTRSVLKLSKTLRSSRVSATKKFWEISLLKSTRNIAESSWTYFGTRQWFKPHPQGLFVAPSGTQDSAIVIEDQPYNLGRVT